MMRALSKRCNHNDDREGSAYRAAAANVKVGAPRGSTMLPEDVVARYRIKNGEGFRLKDIDPADTAGLDLEKEEAKQMLERGKEKLRNLQERLYAEAQWGVLIVLQAMDAAGKDGAIEHVMAGVNPQGCAVTSFKLPSATELRHDFLWRTTVALPERGHIGIFNRSYYEEVLVVRVHEKALAAENLPPKVTGKPIWDERFESIRDFEKHVARNAIVPLKFFLHVSKDEQRRRFLDRIDDKDKRWKFSAGDIAERRLWDDYMAAYEDAIRNTASKDAPWFVVPADNKWFTRLVISAALVEALEKIDPKYPTVSDALVKEMEEAKAALLAEEGSKRGNGKKG
jgi:PPK2 family polyphosphate:nucleotide phosphotransferase